MNLEEFKNRKYLNSGGNADCYLIGEDKVLKLFKNPLKKPIGVEMLKKLKYFSIYENESIVFPTEFLADEKYFYGYITKYIPGKEVKELFSSVNFETFSNHLKPLEQDIEYISNGKIVMNDLSDRNMIYDGSKVTVIDPDCYKIYDIYTVDKVKQTNGYLIRDTITNLIISPLLFTRHEEGYIIQKVYKYIKNNIRVSDLVLEIKKELEDYYKEIINCVDDIKKL